MAAIDQFIANRLNAQKSISTRSLSMSLGTPADCFMQNKPNLLNAQMNVTSVKTMNYEQITMNNANKNKPNQSQFQTGALTHRQDEPDLLCLRLNCTVRVCQNGIINQPWKFEKQLEKRSLTRFN